mmetsp:Transcript_152438/g.266093  ORF Transcript_152438/g.266093 Transcript_152438/m.266093 type:complete len:125 (-) Transcript_152438:135-509(-)
MSPTVDACNPFHQNIKVPLYCTKGSSDEERRGVPVSWAVINSEAICALRDPPITPIGLEESQCAGLPKHLGPPQTLGVQSVVVVIQSKAIPPTHQVSRCAMHTATDHDGHCFVGLHQFFTISYL